MAHMRQARWWIAAFAVLFIGLYAGRGWLLTALDEQLYHADLLQRADAMVVLAPQLDRVAEASDLYRAGYAPVVLLTREVQTPAEKVLAARGITREAGEEERRRILEALGVPASAIVILPARAASTADEARLVGEWARAHSARRVLVVTSPRTPAVRE